MKPSQIPSFRAVAERYNQNPSDQEAGEELKRAIWRLYVNGAVSLNDVFDVRWTVLYGRPYYLEDA